ncbi:hypothetical protein ACFT1A_29570 [Rhodococcus sp. NPDC057135]
MWRAVDQHGNVLDILIQSKWRGGLRVRAGSSGNC